MADDTGDPGAPESASGEGEGEDASGGLGDAGKRALAEERSARRKAEKAAKAAVEELERIQQANQSESEKALAQARAEARAEALGEANGRVLRAEVIAAAAGKLADPSDAVSLIDLSTFEVDDDGNVDAKSISSAIDELVKAKPYLAADAGARPGTGGAGARQQAPKSIDPLEQMLRDKVGAR